MPMPQRGDIILMTQQTNKNRHRLRLAVHGQLQPPRQSQSLVLSKHAWRLQQDFLSTHNIKVYIPP